jgi:D-cysteine desulfhydrase family pyridoxal phosphate-dependent enzyme
MSLRGGFMKIDAPRVLLTSMPTPVAYLKRLTELLGGPRILIKRDDLTGLAGGGNKTRKLEFLIADALESNADTVVTVGSVQSNHCRQTAAAAARYGLRCILVLRGYAPPEVTGNLLLDHLLGAEVRWSGDREREAVMDEVVNEERKAGRKPYAIPLGGSTPLGAVGYALALEEALDQFPEKVDRIFFASSSGGTHAGLVAGARVLGYEGMICGISVDEPLKDLQSTVARIATGVLQLLGGSGAIIPDDILASADYLGQGYAVMGPLEREAIKVFARKEGILLDPVYTARAAGGMLDMIRNGMVGNDETILFWHTGGTPALWAYARELLG